MLFSAWICALNLLLGALTPVGAVAEDPPMEGAKAAAPVRVVVLERLLTGVIHRYKDLPVEAWLDRIEYFPKGTSRWHFTCWNKSNEAVHFDLRRKESYLTDENGEKYPAGELAEGWSRTDDGVDHKLYAVKAGEKQSFWIEFQVTKPKAEQLTLRLASDLPFPVQQLRIPYKPLPERPPEATTPERLDEVAKTITPSAKANKVLSNTAEYYGKVPYILQIEKVEFLANGDVRLHLSAWNKSEKKIYDNFNFEGDKGKSQLLDDKGRGCLLSGSSLGTSHRNKIEIACDPGEKKAFWLEFRGPFKGGKRLVLRLANDMGLPDLRLTLP